MKQELNYLRHAFLFYSRIPTGAVEYSDLNLIKAFRYFPLVGAVVGALSGGVYALCAIVLPHAVALLMALSAGLLLTGALHEDGFSDFFDAFGGGHTKERILQIMKDSNIGAYGVIALIMLFALKGTLLYETPPGAIPLVLIAAGSSARFMSIAMSHISVYARNEEQGSKSMHLKNRIDFKTTLIALVIATAPLLLLDWRISVAVLVGYPLILLAMRAFCHKRIGGYTGDTLGALEQMCELYFMMVSAIILTFPY